MQAERAAWQFLSRSSVERVICKSVGAAFSIMIFRVAIFSCGAFSGLASALPVALVQASEPDTINIDFDVPSAGLREAKSNLDGPFAVHGRSASASSVSASLLSSPEVDVHVPVPAVSSRKASAWLRDA